jgi:DNA-binding FadR family transcriptional regulator
VVGQPGPLCVQFTGPLSRTADSVHKQIYRSLRSAVLSGKLGADTRPPSTRDLAEQIGVLCSVVLEAYDQLMAEGFIVGRSGSGPYVARGLLSHRTRYFGASCTVAILKMMMAKMLWYRFNIRERAARSRTLPSKRHGE